MDTRFETGDDHNVTAIVRVTDEHPMRFQVPECKGLFVSVQTSQCTQYFRLTPEILNFFKTWKPIEEKKL